METVEAVRASEQARLTNLLSLGILDGPPPHELDEIARLAALACGTESSAITLVDNNCVWLKSRVGVAVAQLPRDQALCSLEIDQGELLVIPDTWQDDRCCGNPLTTGDQAIRFYVGAPLITSAGQCVGRLCVFDRSARLVPDKRQNEVLIGLARMAVDLIEARRYRRIGQIAAQVMDVTSDAILCADADGRITYWNGAAEAMFGHPAERAVGAALDMIMPPTSRKAHSEGLARAAAGGPMKLAGRPVELVAVRADNTLFPVELSLGRWQDGDLVAFAAIIRDVSSRKLLEREREQARTFLQTVIENLPAMLFVKDAETQRYLLMNKAGAEIAGRSQNDFFGRRDSELFPGLGEGYEARDRAACDDPGIHVFESEHVRDDGQRFSLRTKRLAISAGPDGPRYLLGMTEDVTEARRAQAEVQRLAEYDSLTGLRNRAGFVARLDTLAAEQVPFTLVGIDLDRFKAVNDQFGHIVGDEVLAQVGARLGTLASRGDMIARVGGDEFVMVLVGPEAGQRAGELAPVILAAMEEPVSTGRIRAFIGASIGVASFPADGKRAAEVRQAADLALYRAKQGGRGIACFYNEVMDTAVREHRLLEQALREALETDAIDLAFQPVFAIGTRTITSFEALARWTHPTRGAVPPLEFIGLAEECGLIETLGTKVLCLACKAAVGWPEDVCVAVNLSPLQFQTGRLCDSVQSVLEETGLPADRLQLEVTEGLLIRDVDRTFAQLEQLRGLGIQILMDDFGVGYSSLSYFQRFPFDKVKIDRSFVDGLSTSPAAQAIIGAVVQLGSALDMGVVAEGVETNEQLRALINAGCTHVQGYLLGRPISVDAVEDVLQSYIVGDALE